MRALVTGASRGGIGGAIARRLAADAARRHEQAHIVISATGVNPDFWALKADLIRPGVAVHAVAGDLRGDRLPGSLVRIAAEFCGGLDLVVSCAGRTPGGALENTSTGSWDETMNVHARAPWLLAKAAFTRLADSRGSFIAIGSIAGREPLQGAGAYPVAKAALAALCRVLAAEWGQYGIRVNTVSPGLIATQRSGKPYAGRITPLGRAGLPEDVASAVAFLAGGDAAFITGQDIVVDGGFTCAGLTRIAEARSQHA
jgi:NAD(P)-dependent dehydrogenase (short-subunit alcohol dehydrogenase family)